MDRILLWAVQSQGQWRSISTVLSLDRHRGWPPHPSQRNGGCSTIIEEREVIWNEQHPSIIGPSRWRGCNHGSQDNLRQDLADRRMANHMDPVLSHHTSQERRPAAVPELPNNQPHQSPKQSHAEDHTEQMEATSGEDHYWRAGRNITEQIFNLWILCEKYLQYQQDLYHVYMRSNFSNGGQFSNHADVNLQITQIHAEANMHFLLIHSV